MALVVTITDISDNGKKVTLYGTLDTQTSPSLEEKLEPLLTEKPPILIFDLSDLEFISSAGLRILFKTKKELQTWDGEMMMLKPQPQIEKVFDVNQGASGYARVRQFRGNGSLSEAGPRAGNTRRQSLSQPSSVGFHSQKRRSFSK